MAGVKDTTQRGSTHYWHKGEGGKNFCRLEPNGGGGGFRLK